MTQNNNIEEMIPRFLRRIEENAEDVEALYELGRISSTVGRNGEARNFLARAVALEPWHKEAQKLLNEERNKLNMMPLQHVVTLVHGAFSAGETCTLKPGNKETEPSVLPEYYSYARPEIQQLVKSSARRILDIGCAAGILGSALKQKTGAEVWGVECVIQAAQLAETRLDRVLQGTIEEMLPLLPDGYFDTIIMADVLEHLVEPGELLRSIQSKLAVDGEIVASIPNVRHWSVVKSLLQGNWRYEDAGILDRTHLRFFTKSECLRLFESSGYEIARGEAIVLKDDEQIPATVVGALEKAGLNVATLAEESLHYQYAFVVKPSRMASVPPVLKNRIIPGLTSIIILTWNQLPYTESCLKSIAAQTPEPYELVIVDNGSTDGTVAWLHAQAAIDERIKLIINSENIGFAAGCNQGIKAALGEYLLLLNNDTVVTPEWLSGLHEVLNRYPDAGIVGPMTNSASGIQVISSAGYKALNDLPDWAETFRNNNRYRVIPLRRIVGFCLLFKQELVEKIGLLDESFGSGNYEDDDYCLRAELAGYRNMIAGDVFVHHEGGATFTGNRLDRGNENRKNRIIFKKKWEPTRLDESLLRQWLTLNAVEEAKKEAERGEVDNAVKTLLNKGIKIFPASPLPYFELAQILIRAGRYHEALGVLPEMPTEADRILIHELEAICQAAVGDDGAAYRAANQAPLHPQSMVVLGTLAARQGDMVSAEAFFRRSIELDPSSGSGWLSLGMLLWGEGKQEEAWQFARRSVIVDPLNTATIAIMRDMAERLGYLQDALQIIIEASRLYPESRTLALVHAETLADCGSSEEALKACEQFLAQYGSDGNLLTMALKLRERSGSYDRLSEAGSQSISLCMIVKNEESCLARCLLSVKPLVHEMIVVDTGSSDKTAEIATVFGAKVSTFIWNGSFSDARNHSIEQASGDWVLVMDADETLSRLDYDDIRRLIASSSGKKSAWSVVTRTYTDRINTEGWTANDGMYPDEEQSDGWYPSAKVRLFPRHASIRFSGKVHEMVESSLRESGHAISTAPFVVHHYGELEAKQNDPEKQLRYFEAGLQKLNQNPDDLAAIAELAVQAGELGEFETAIQLWDRILAKIPNAVEALFNKGYCLMGLKRYDEALKISQRAMELDPKHKEAALNYGTCELYVGDPAKALTLIAPVAEKNPDYPLIQALLATLLLAQGMPDNASVIIEALKKKEYAVQEYILARAGTLETLGRKELGVRIASLL